MYKYLSRSLVDNNIYQTVIIYILHIILRPAADVCRVMDKKNTSTAYTYDVYSYLTIILYSHVFQISTLLCRRREMVYIILIFVRPWRYIGVPIPILLDR